MSAINWGNLNYLETPLNRHQAETLEFDQWQKLNVNEPNFLDMKFKVTATGLEMEIALDIEQRIIGLDLINRSDPNGPFFDEFVKHFCEVKGLPNIAPKLVIMTDCEERLTTVPILKQVHGDGLMNPISFRQVIDNTKLGRVVKRFGEPKYIFAEDMATVNDGSGQLGGGPSLIFIFGGVKGGLHRGGTWHEAVAL